MPQNFYVNSHYNHYAPITNIQKVPSEKISCTASSEYSSDYSCEKAFDGILDMDSKSNAWATKGEGVNSWIKAEFSELINIKEIRILQRYSEVEQNKKIDLKFVGPRGYHYLNNVFLPVTGSKEWNYIRLPQGFVTDELTIKVREVYKRYNNGFKEIEFY